MKARPAVPFLIMGVTFLALGVSGQRGFLGIGGAFLVIGAALMLRQKRTGDSK